MEIFILSIFFIGFAIFASFVEVFIKVVDWVLTPKKKRRR